MLSGLAGRVAKLSILSDCLAKARFYLSPLPSLPDVINEEKRMKRWRGEGTSVCVALELALPAFTHLPR